MIAGNHYGIDLKIVFPVNIDEPQDFKVIGNAEILTRLGVDDVSGVNADNDLRLIFHLFKELDLGVFIKARKYTHSVLVMYKFSSEFQIQPFTVLMVDPFQNVLGLFLNIPG